MNLATANSRLAALRVVDEPCSTCKAKPGEPCKTKGGLAIAEEHAPRQAQYQAHRDELRRLVEWEKQ